MIQLLDEKQLIQKHIKLFKLMLLYELFLIKQLEFTTSAYRKFTIARSTTYDLNLIKLN